MAQDSPPSLQPPPSSSESSRTLTATSTTDEKSVAATPHPSGRISKEDAWKVLESACTEKSGTSRASAIRALGLISYNARARKLAEQALADDNSEIRLAAATALGEMKARASIPKLREVLSDSDPTVALAAAHSLELMHNRAAYDVYTEVLTGERKAHRGLIASQTAALKDPKKIAQLGIREGVSFIPFGGLGWGALKIVSKDDTSPVRAAAARALANDPNPAAMKVLSNAAGDGSWMVRTAALEALAKRGNPAALDTVRLFVYDEKDTVRYTAAAAVLRLMAIRSSAGPADKHNGEKGR
jgi:HEAT repeat protein